MPYVSKKNKINREIRELWAGKSKHRTETLFPCQKLCKIASSPRAKSFAVENMSEEKPLQKHLKVPKLQYTSHILQRA